MKCVKLQSVFFAGALFFSTQACFAAWLDIDGAGQESVNISNNAVVSRNPSLKLDSDKNVHIVREDSASGYDDIYYVTWDGSAWVDADGSGQESVNLTDGLGDCYSPSLMIDLLDKPHVTWDCYPLGGPSDIYYVRWTGEWWADFDGAGQEGINISNTAGDSYSPAMKLDPSNYAHIVWVDETEGNSEIYYLKCLGGAWVDVDSAGQEGINISSTSGTSIRPVLFLDSSDLPHVAWEDNSTGSTEVYYLKWNGVEWVDADGSGQESINISNSGGSIISGRPSLYLDSSDHAHIAWHEGISTSGTERNGLT